MIRSLYVKSQSIASTSNTKFWWALQMQTEWIIFETARRHYLGLKAQNFEDPIFTFWCFSLKAVYNSCKLQRLLQVAKFLFIYSFIHTNIIFPFRDLPTEIVIFMNVCYQMKFFSDGICSFFRTGFANIKVIPSQVIDFLFQNIFIIRIRPWIFQTVNLYFVCFWNIAR